MIECQEVVEAGSTVHSRMFAPAMAIAEDPATGAASGPLGCYLVRHGRVKPARVVEIISQEPNRLKATGLCERALLD